LAVYFANTQFKKNSEDSTRVRTHDIEVEIVAY